MKASVNSSKAVVIYLPGLGIGKGGSEGEKYIKSFHLLTIKYSIAFFVLVSCFSLFWVVIYNCETEC